MSKSKSFKKTVIKVEVISEGDWRWGNLADVVRDITDGGCSGVYEVDDVTFLSEEDTAKALSKQGSCPSFLLGEEWAGWKPTESEWEPSFEQVENWRRSLHKVLGSAALLMSDSKVREVYERIQQSNNENSERGNTEEASGVEVLRGAQQRDK